MSEIINKIEDIENKISHKLIMEKYSDLEIELQKNIKNSHRKLNINQKKIFKNLYI